MKVLPANPFLPVLPLTAITRFQKQPVLQTSLNRLNQFHQRADATRSELCLSLPPTTQRSPISSANAGLNDTTPMELVIVPENGCITEADLLR
jgi:hypothetical protein